MTRLHPHPGDSIAVYQYSDPTVTLSDRARLRAAVENPWQLPPVGETWRKLPLWTGANGTAWEIIVLTIDLASNTAVVTSPSFPLPLCMEGIKVPLTHIEILQRGIYDRNQLDRICRGLPADEPDTDAQAGTLYPTVEGDRIPHSRQSRSRGNVRGSDRAAAERETAEAQQSIF